MKPPRSWKLKDEGIDQSKNSEAFSNVAGVSLQTQRVQPTPINNLRNWVRNAVKLKYLPPLLLRCCCYCRYHCCCHAAVSAFATRLEYSIAVDLQSYNSLVHCTSYFIESYCWANMPKHSKERITTQNLLLCKSGVPRPVIRLDSGYNPQLENNMGFGADIPTPLDMESIRKLRKASKIFCCSSGTRNMSSIAL